MSGLDEFHGFALDGVRWRVTGAGVDIEGSGLERTPGTPKTAQFVWKQYGALIQKISVELKVPPPLIAATICTESGGRAEAIRLEPGYKSDEETPRRISVGLMQTLISTAADMMKTKVTRDWLKEPVNSLRAGTKLVAQQASRTKFDPPLVAAAYNAGGLYPQNGMKNRWKVRQYPIGAGGHCDHFVRFYNDICMILLRENTQPRSAQFYPRHHIPR